MASKTKQFRRERASLAHYLEETFASFWWVILFIIACYLGFEHGLIKKDDDFTRLQAQYRALQKQKAALVDRHDSLVRQINSQSDPAWVELTLMKGLGLVPEGQIKVLFTDDTKLHKHNLN